MKVKRSFFIAVMASAALCVGYLICQAVFSPARTPSQRGYFSGGEGFSIISSAMAVEAHSTEATGIEAGSVLFDFSDETVGASPETFTPAVGNWIIGSDNGNTVLVVDGRKWQRGVASAGLADKARALYGKRYAEFLDNVTAYAYFPFAVAVGVDGFTNGEIKVKFKSISGRIDQGAGILFDLKPNGDYYALRANPLENNLVLWRYKHGSRSSVSWVRNVNTPSRKWHSLRLTVKGKHIKGFVNGKQYIAYTLPADVSGKVGLWTKADSVIYFDDYQVTSR